MKKNELRCETLKIMDYYRIFNTKYGNILILWKFKANIPKIYRIYLDKEKPIINNLLINNKELSCNMIYETIKNISLYFSGKNITFNLDIIDLDICPDFQKKVILTEYNIPRGYVSTYKKISTYLHNPNGSRAVGNALAKNPFPIIIPCHRAVKSDGTLGGYQGGIQMKYELLKMEGINFNKNNKILFENIYY